MAKYKMFPKVSMKNRMWPDKVIEKAPIWCSVDLRDGNQALVTPMNINEKLKLFKLLVSMGFKEIEVGFPSASQIEYDFTRLLIENNLIPDDVYIQVLTQAREHLIHRTFESLKGAKNVIVHLYNSTSILQRKITFNKTKEEIMDIAIEGTKLVKSLVPSLPNTNVRFQYSAESFSDTEVEYAKEVYEAVMDIWQPTEGEKIIINLPETVQWSTPNVFADQVEWIHANIKDRKKIILSIHAHNDRGTAIASSELAVLAGADRVEGTLFGNGERTGNLDIINYALNLYVNGIDPKLDVFDMPNLVSVYKECTKMEIYQRHPYAGELVFTAFSGSHQDAIKKGMDIRDKINDKNAAWEVPYLTIDPKDINRSYEAIIRINSQSGKGGVAFILSREFGFDLPKNMHPEVGAYFNNIADKKGKELSFNEIYNYFSEEFIEKDKPLKLLGIDIKIHNSESHIISAKVIYKDKEIVINGEGNGPINAFVHALEKQGWKDFQFLNYSQHAIGKGSETEAVTYIEIQNSKDKKIWGVGLDTDITKSSIKALISAFNRANQPN